MAAKLNRSTEQIRKIWGNRPAKPSELVLFRFSTGSRPLVQIRQGAEPHFRALDAVFNAWRYPVREAGGFSDRPITGGTGLSTHAFGTTVDVNPAENPYGRTLITDQPVCMVANILGIETAKGQRVFRHGVDWDGDGDTTDTTYFDAMHFEVQLTRAELTQVLVVPPHPLTGLPIDLSPRPILARGAREDEVRELQTMLNRRGAGLRVDGGFGAITERAVKSFQERAGLVPDGIVAGTTWAALSGS